MIRGSLQLRLLAAAGLMLIAFLGLSGAALERAFHEAARKSMQEQLKVHIYALLSALELDRQGRPRLPEPLPEPRFAIPGSGLYGFVFLRDRLLWRSPSALGIELSPQRVAAGKILFIREHAPELWVLYYGVLWETVRRQRFPLVVAVASDAGALTREVDRFRHTLWLWLGGCGLLLLALQAGLLRWSLRPLRAIATDLAAIENGRKDCLHGSYPKELAGLVANLNTLLHSERAHLERYRNTLADLAHSLKTPLAVLRGLSQNQPLPPLIQTTLHEQLDRMQMLVDYQLQKAAARGTLSTLTPVAVWPVLERICASLDKVYAEKNVCCILEGDESARGFLEEGDLYELLGNLLDNAYKFCQQRVKVTVSLLSAHGKRHPDLVLRIEDDGHGIAEALRSEVVKRGIRADQATSGHGIGLAVVAELVRLNRGRMRYLESELGGAGWEIRLPAPS
ncbi:MAG: ATP-binding protein [Methylohalobius sp.]|nr:ATP-binding protein [Methylohalobius sp.]